MSIKEDLEKTLDLEPTSSNSEIMVVSNSNISIIEDLSDDDLFQKDFETARNNIYELIEEGKELLDGIKNLAKAGDTARSYEVAGEILTKLVQTQKDLVELHQRRKIVIVDENKNNPTGIINIEGNAIFSGTTADLHKALKG